MTPISCFRFTLLPIAVLGMAYFQSPAFAASGPNMLTQTSPQQIADDSRQDFDSVTGAPQITSPSFDPFEDHDGLAGTASLRTAGEKLTLSGAVITGGALLDIKLVYTTTSNAPHDNTGYDSAVFLSGTATELTAYDNRILECSEKVREVVYDDSYYKGAPYGYLAGIYRHYPYYRGHSRFKYRYGGYDSYIAGPRRLGHSGFARGVRRGRRVEPHRGRLRPIRPNGQISDRFDRGQGTASVIIGSQGERPPPRRRGGVRGERRIFGDNIQGFRVLGDSIRGEAIVGDISSQPSSQTQTQIQQSQPQPQPQPQSQPSNPVAPAGQGQTGGTSGQAVDTARRLQDQRLPRPRGLGEAERAQVLRETGRVRVNRQRGNRPVLSTPNRTPQRSRGADVTRRQSQNQARIRNQSRSRAQDMQRPQIRKPSQRAIDRSVDKHFKSRNLSRHNYPSRHNYKGQARIYNFYPALGAPVLQGGYRYLTSQISYKCAREESLSVYIPMERLKAARFDGLTIVVLDRAGHETPVYVPPNYVEGFLLASDVLMEESKQNPTPELNENSNVSPPFETQPEARIPYQYPQSPE